MDNKQYVYYQMYQTVAVLLIILEYQNINITNSLSNSYSLEQYPGSKPLPSNMNEVPANIAILRIPNYGVSIQSGQYQFLWAAHVVIFRNNFTTCRNHTLRRSMFITTMGQTYFRYSCTENKFQKLTKRPSLTLINILQHKLLCRSDPVTNSRKMYSEQNLYVRRRHS